jgi:hypothetical protein
MELDSFLVSLYVLVDDWLRERHRSAQVRLGRPTLLSESEVLTLAILAQWPRFRSERNEGLPYCRDRISCERLRVSLFLTPNSARMVDLQELVTLLCPSSIPQYR